MARMDSDSATLVDDLPQSQRALDEAYKLWGLWGRLRFHKLGFRSINEVETVSLQGVNADVGNS